MIMSEVLYQAPKKDYFCEASVGKVFFLGLIKCHAHNKPPYKNLYLISWCDKENFSHDKNLFMHHVCNKDNNAQIDFHISQL